MRSQDCREYRDYLFPCILKMKISKIWQNHNPFSRSGKNFRYWQTWIFHPFCNLNKRFGIFELRRCIHNDVILSLKMYTEVTPKLASAEATVRSPGDLYPANLPIRLFFRPPPKSQNGSVRPATLGQAKMLKMQYLGNNKAVKLGEEFGYHLGWSTPVSRWSKPRYLYETLMIDAQCL